MEQEIWKFHPKFKGMVEFSNLGRVRSYYRYNEGKILINRVKDNTGYGRLYINGKRYKIHRFIAELFVPNPEHKTEVNHKDGNKLNNRADNLEWVTRSENQKHAYKLGLQKPSEKQKQATSKWNRENRIKTVYQYNLKGDLVTTYDSCKECSQHFNTSEATISRHCNQRKPYKNYILSY